MKSMRPAAPRRIECFTNFRPLLRRPKLNPKPIRDLPEILQLHETKPDRVHEQNTSVEVEDLDAVGAALKHAVDEPSVEDLFSPSRHDWS
jgi:hypothetical protein